MMTARPNRHWTARLAILLPYGWLVAFFLAPFLIILKISLSQSAIAQPPYTPVFDLATGWESLKDAFSALSLDNYASIVTDRLYVWSYRKLLQAPTSSTPLLLLIGYPA